jgi:hypothetical protein
MGTPDVLLEVIDRRIGRAVRPGAVFATVASTSPLTVTFPGDSSAVPVSREKTYTPVFGETAVLLRVGTRWVAVGGLA